MSGAIKYCNICGSSITLAIPPGDNRLRQICDSCGIIQYQNPKIVSGCIPYWEDKILLCNRAIEPRRGYWTIPAGYLEIGETIEEGAHRETWEEACTKVEDLELYQIYNLPLIGQVYMIYRGRMKDPEAFGIGEESLDVRMVDQKSIPWDDLAFKVIHNTLERFISEHRQGVFSLQISSSERKW